MNRGFSPKPGKSPFDVDCVVADASRSRTCLRPPIHYFRVFHGTFYDLASGGW